jgi:hypothetical protein
MVNGVAVSAMNEEKRRKMAHPETYGTKDCQGAGIRCARGVSLAKHQWETGRFTRTNAVYGTRGQLVSEPSQRVHTRGPDGKRVVVYRKPVGWIGGVKIRRAKLRSFGLSDPIPARVVVKVSDATSASEPAQ